MQYILSELLTSEFLGWIDGGVHFIINSDKLVENYQFYFMHILRLKVTESIVYCVYLTCAHKKHAAHRNQI